MIHQELKEQGNQFFKNGQYKQALEFYEKSLELDDNNSIVYANKCRALKQLHRYKEAYIAIEKSLLIEKNNMKHLILKLQILGNLILDNDEFRQQKIYILNIESTLSIIQSLDQKQQEEFHNIIQDTMNKLKKIEKFKQKTIKNNILYKISNYLKQYQGYQKHIEYLDKLFERNNKSKEIPEFLCCQITLEVFNCPMISSSGISYEKKDIEFHLEHLGQFDPVTRKELQMKELIKNRALEEYIRDYQNENVSYQEYF